MKTTTLIRNLTAILSLIITGTAAAGDFICHAHEGTSTCAYYALQDKNSYFAPNTSVVSTERGFIVPLNAGWEPYVPASSTATQIPH